MTTVSEKKSNNDIKYNMVAGFGIKKNLICIGRNLPGKTHPLTPQINSEYIIPIHAEVDCISKFYSNKRLNDSYDIGNLTLYVVGLTKSRNITNVCISSKPCQSCEILIKRFGVMRIVYIDRSEKNEITVKEVNYGCR
jgi:deoxycytidylate deaminase